MFAECGMDEPDEEMDRVRKSCPIELDEKDSSEVLAGKITSFSQKKFKRTS